MIILIVVVFNLHGLFHIRIGWNTHLQWMRYIVYLALQPGPPQVCIPGYAPACEELGMVWPCGGGGGGRGPTSPVQWKMQSLSRWRCSNGLDLPTEFNGIFTKEGLGLADHLHIHFLPTKKIIFTLPFLSKSFHYNRSLNLVKMEYKIHILHDPIKGWYINFLLKI